MIAIRSRLAALCAGACMCPPWAAAAQDLPDSPEESRAALEQACRDEGQDEATCSCLGDFVDDNFTDRELAGAAFVLSDSLMASDPEAGIAALLSAGYTLEEITTVVERVVSLEEAATTTCAIPESPDAGGDAQ